MLPLFSLGLKKDITRLEAWFAEMLGLGEFNQGINARI
jgi:hypothetical protein